MWPQFLFRFALHFILIEPLFKGHLSYKATFSLSQRWPLNTGDCLIEVTAWAGLTVFVELDNNKQVEYRVKSPKFLLHVFQYYYLNIEILKFYENWNVWNFLKILKSYENLEFFWNLKFLNILKFSHFLKILNFKFFLFIFFILEFWNFWKFLKF